MRFLRVAAAALILTAVAAGPAFAGAAFADLSISKIGTPIPLPAGTNATYTITVQNLGPNTSFASMDDTLPAGMTFVSLTGPLGWTLTTPAVGSPGTVTATIVALTVAAGAQTFTLVTHLDAATAPGTTVINNATVTVGAGVADPTPGNNTATMAMDVVAAPPPTPVPSVPNAAMPEPNTGSPIAVLGFLALLVSVLATAAVWNRRRYRSH